MRIGQSLELAPLSHDEKTSLWNQNAAFGPFGEPHVMDRADLARAQFVFRGASTTGRSSARLCSMALIAGSSNAEGPRLAMTGRLIR